MEKHDKIFMENAVFGKITSKEFYGWIENLTENNKQEFFKYATSQLNLIKQDTWDRYLNKYRMSIDEEYAKKKYAEELDKMNTGLIVNANYNYSFTLPPAAPQNSPINISYPPISGRLTGNIP